jgi:hypothetical protein
MISFLRLDQPQEAIKMITATLKRAWKMIDAGENAKERDVTVQPGTYELERVRNPYAYSAKWLVLKGTLIGMTEGSWMQWINGTLANKVGHADYGKPIDWDEFEIILIEDGIPIPPPQDPDVLSFIEARTAETVST